MPFSIRYKLFLTLLLATGVVVAGMHFATRWSFERGLVRLVESRQQERLDNLVERLAELYQNQNGWESLRGDKERWVQVLFADRPLVRHFPSPWLQEAMHGPASAWPPPMAESPDGRPPRRLELRVMLLDADKSVIFGQTDQTGRLTLNPIRVEGRTVGYLGVLPGPLLQDLGDIRFQEEQTRAFLAIALVMVLTSAILAMAFASSLTKPLKALTAAVKALAHGRYATRIPVQSGDEVGQLARDFNDLAHALDKAEQARRQWVADISHELRTPLAVLRGELEALQDGVRPLTPAAVDSLHGDVMHLSRLVDDLYQLSMSDLGTLSYRKTATDPLAILEDEAGGLASEFARRQLQLRIANLLPAPVTLHADPDRLAQLYRNLLNNSLRYTDPGGRLEVRVHRDRDRLLMDFQDSAPAVSEADLPRLFERFYRVEGSRSRTLGGAGLGLAICRNIVEAHDGQISAKTSPLGGLWIRVDLPVRP